MNTIEEKILDLFLNTKENTAPAISRKTGFSLNLVNKIIDNYLKQLK